MAKLLLYLIKGEGIKNLMLIAFTIGSFTLAIIDKEYRPYFADLAKIGLGGYLAQLIPKKEN